MYYGGLQAEGSPLPFQRLLTKYYDGELSGLLLTMTWGGYEARDADIVEDLGLAYRSFRCDISGGQRDFFVLRDERWRPCGPINHLQLFEEYVEKNEEFVRGIVHKIAVRSDAGIVDASSAEAILDDVADVERGRQLQLYFNGTAENCGLCGSPLNEEKYMADGEVAGSGGAWGCMCADCFTFGGGQVGWGAGQLYLRADGKWMLVGGFPSEDTAG